MRVIGQLKSGNDICPSTVNNANEDSNSTDIPSQVEQSEVTQVSFIYHKRYVEMEMFYLEIWHFFKCHLYCTI